MSGEFLQQVKLIIYRFKEKGLEIFTVNDEVLPASIKVPHGGSDHFFPHRMFDQNTIISLEPIEQSNGEVLHAYAIEGDWHEIPSIRGKIYDDVKFVKSKIINALPNFDEGTYIQAKEAFKKARPNEYKLLKELKDILKERSSLLNL